jgi:SAM-dependent methyltransferase
VLKDHQDAYGHEFLDYLQTGKAHEIIEREDGYIDVSGGFAYLAEYRHWHPIERAAMRYARGRVLDVGCGAGRHALYLQEKGLDVLGIDSSPLAIEVCRQRGLRCAEVRSISQVSTRLGTFDTVLMMGNNFGLFGSFMRARKLLARLGKATSKRGRIVASSMDPYGTEAPEHLVYQAENRARGRMSGQIRLRARYKKYVTPWFDYLLVSQDEMHGILDGTGWVVNKYLDSNGAAGYIAIIDKKIA